MHTADAPMKAGCTISECSNANNHLHIKRQKKKISNLSVECESMSLCLIYEYDSRCWASRDAMTPHRLPFADVLVVIGACCNAGEMRHSKLIEE
jgi:hypothetical protein